MSDWSAGYVSDVGYTFGYFPELNPLRTRLAFLNHGLVFPEVATACELGFGQGISVNIHSAASQTEWYGTDFNPSQAGFAQEMAKAAGAGVKLTDDDFERYLNRDDLPDFDFIGLHGIWSWVSDRNRQTIVEFIRRKLKVGGVLFVSYNTYPGWASFAPLRHLMTQHAETLGAEGKGTINRVNEAVAFAENLLQTGPLYAKANPQSVDRLAKIKDQNAYYLAHEYFNKDWHPMHFADVANWLEPAKVQYACTAHYLDQIDVLNLTKEQQQFLNNVPDPKFRESVRDFMVNQLFRRDYWVKGVRRLNPVEQAETIRKQRVLLVTPVDEISLKVSGSLGEANMNEGFYKPVIALFADHKIKTIGQVEQELKDKQIPFAQLMQIIMVLSGIGNLRPVQDDQVISKSRKQSDRLNRYILNMTRGSSEVTVLSSPVIGGGFTVNRYQQLFLLGLLNNKNTPDELAQFAWSIFSIQGQKLLKEGKRVESTEENLDELNKHANKFLATYLPILKVLQIA